jgi:hypothetical protein
MDDEHIEYIHDDDSRPTTPRTKRMHSIISYLREERGLVKEMATLEQTVKSLMWRNVNLHRGARKLRYLKPRRMRPPVEYVSVNIQRFLANSLDEIDTIKQNLKVDGAPGEIHQWLLRKQRALDHEDEMFQYNQESLDKYTRAIMYHTRRITSFHRLIEVLQRAVQALLDVNAQQAGAL